MNHAESRLQSACVTWFRLQYPHYASHLFAIGNGVPNNARQGAIRKREGAVRGVADLMLMLPIIPTHNGLFLEAKTDKGRQSAEQKKFEQRAEEMGYAYKVFRSFDEFKEAIEWYIE